MSGKSSFYLLCVVCYTGYGGSVTYTFVIFVVTTPFPKRSKICWLLSLVCENFDSSNIRVCNMSNRKAQCVICGGCIFLDVHTRHHTNFRTLYLMLVCVTSHCCVGNVDYKGYKAFR